jgi:predicted RNA-binding Zn-ribbon protein involved in translation (DUF1610 family)
MTYRKKERKIMKRVTILFLVLMMVACNGCRSKKTEEPAVEDQQVEAQVETQVAEEAAETAVTEEKSSQGGMGVNCLSCNGTLEPSEDKKMMVCTKCGKEMDRNTYNGMMMQKMLETMKKAQETQEKQQ